MPKVGKEFVRRLLKLAQSEADDEVLLRMSLDQLRERMTNDGCTLSDDEILDIRQRLSANR